MFTRDKFYGLFGLYVSDEEKKVVQEWPQWPKVIKHFTPVLYKFTLLARVFVPAKPFKASLMHAGKAGTYPKEEPFRCSSLG